MQNSGSCDDPVGTQVKITDGPVAGYQSMDHMFPLRVDVNVSIRGLPRDMTGQEAARLASWIELLVIKNATCPECDSKLSGRIVNHCLDCNHNW